MSLLKSPPYFVQQSRLSSNSACQSPMEEPGRFRSSTVSFSPDIDLPKEQQQSTSMYTLDRPVYRNCSRDRFKKASSVDPPQLNKSLNNTTTTTLHPTYYSQRSLNDQEEPVWIKRRLSNSTIERLFDRRKPFLWKEIIDATV